ncbi:MAG: hypothetical protein KGO81_03265 [Bacteroidota bacterium]|nr:hypothetical protein [Bacteroidota bacterium]
MEQIEGGFHWKCLLGIIGGALLGASAVLSGGSSLAIVGGTVGGGLAGAAASCFN